MASREASALGVRRSRTRTTAGPAGQSGRGTPVATPGPRPRGDGCGAGGGIGEWREFRHDNAFGAIGYRVEKKKKEKTPPYTRTAARTAY